MSVGLSCIINDVNILINYISNTETIPQVMNVPSNVLWPPYLSK